MFLASILLSSGHATLTYSETSVDTAAIAAAATAGDIEAVKRLSAAGKVTHHSRSFRGDTSLESMQSFAAATLKRECVVVKATATDDCNVLLVSAPVAAPAKRK